MIWKTPDQKPEEYETILFESYEWGEPELGHYQGGLFVPHNDEFESLESDDVEKWCYLDELIAQADKAERLQKAVDYALDTLKKAETTRELTVKGHYVNAISLDELHSALTEIKQLIKEQ